LIIIIHYDVEVTTKLRANKFIDFDKFNKIAHDFKIKMDGG
jgi:hypothetical protein